MVSPVGTPLREQLKKHGKPKLSVLQKWSFQILQALEYLLSQKEPLLTVSLSTESIVIDPLTGDAKVAFCIGESDPEINQGSDSSKDKPEFTNRREIESIGQILIEILTLKQNLERSQIH